MEEIAERARVGIIFNAVLNRDGQPVGFVFGDVKAAFRAGTSVAEKVYRIFVPEQTPIVIAGSHLCDIDFWQAHKALYPSDIVVEEGGTIIVVTPCPEGVAVTHPELELFASRSWRDIDSMTTSGQIRDGVAAALAMAWARIRERAQIIMVSAGFGPEKAAELGFLHARTVEEALDLAWMRHGSHARVTVLPYAPDTLPVILSPPPS